MGNFAVDVMWRPGIGIDSRKGTRVGDLRLSWDPFLSLYSASLRSLLENYCSPSLTYLNCLLQRNTLFYNTYARSLHTLEHTRRFLPFSHPTVHIGERKATNTTAPVFFFYAR